MNNDQNRSDQIAILIPVYNEEKTIQTIIDTIKQTVSTPILVVNDGSTDRTIDILQRNDIILLDHQNNRGKGAALLTGFHWAISQGFSGVITLDADGQHDPADLPQFFDHSSLYPDDFIIGARLKNTAAAPKKRLIANRISDFFISWAAGERIHDTQSGYRYYPLRAMHKLFCKKYNNSQKKQGFVFETAILIDAIPCSTGLHTIPIMSFYPSDARASHFRPIADTCQISAYLAWVIASRAFRPIHFYKAFFQPKKRLK